MSEQKQEVYRQVVPAFEKFGQRFGPYTQTIIVARGEQPDRYGFYLEAAAEASRSQYGNIHPHTPSYDGKWGSPWWPTCWAGGQMLPTILKEGAIDEALFALRLFVSESINEEDCDAYCKAEDWNASRKWWCHECSASYPNGTECNCDQEKDKQEEDNA